jgi:tetratricopeptide (TPR) repeat protein
MLAALSRCNFDAQPIHATDSLKQSAYLNHADSALYVGMQTCKGCHEDIYNTFVHTGMGSSFDSATMGKSVAKFGKESTIYDRYRNFWYHSYFKNNQLFIHEYRLDGRDTLYSRIEKVDYIVGSGQHTNSHIYSVNGYLFQMPMTFYAQKGKWDLPPGFEDGHNTRFSRTIGLECMSCHNALPDFAMGSENKFSKIPDGITCERCHGPGSIHVQQKQAGIIIDTSKQIDYSIVNPGKLSSDLQFDVCQRCHLQGNTVLQPGKSFYDFRPGMQLSDVMTVFMPKYKGAEDEFIMASHAERLKMSACFLQVQNNQPKDTLHPYRNGLTCVTCHNPHITVRQTGNEKFNSACSDCHQSGSQKSKLKQCSDTPSHLQATNNNCVSCHMPRSGSIDIPHVTVHDHWIRKPEKERAKVKEAKEFLGLYAVNEKVPAKPIQAKAYIQHYEKFGKDPLMLGKAEEILTQDSALSNRDKFADYVHIYFLRIDYAAVKSYVNRMSVKWVLDTFLVQTSWDNQHAWTAYRIGEACYKMGDNTMAESFYKKATDLAPLHPDFRAKYGLILAINGKKFEARTALLQVLMDYPKHVQAHTNLGFLWLQENNEQKAEEHYKIALSLDPDDDQALLNMAGLYIYRKAYKQAMAYVNRCLAVQPQNEQALEIRKQLQSLM